MADPKHLNVLRQGADFWNLWRNANSVPEPDLGGADLSRAYLPGVDLADADLGGVNFGFAYLHEANFTNANLEGAQLSGARCDNACFSEAVLIGASFCYADLNRANFGGADLRYATLGGATVGGTGLANLDLSLTDGLLSCKHLGPSLVTDQTLEKSGCLPTLFLRGVGLTDWEIERNKLYRPFFG